MLVATFAGSAGHRRKVALLPCRGILLSRRFGIRMSSSLKVDGGFRTCDWQVQSGAQEIKTSEEGINGDAAPEIHLLNDMSSNEHYEIPRTALVHGKFQVYHKSIECLPQTLRRYLITSSYVQHAYTDRISPPAEDGISQEPLHVLRGAPKQFLSPHSRLL